MLSVKELSLLAGSLPPLEFKRQMGPFALIQRPPDEMVAQLALRLGAQRTLDTPRDKVQGDVQGLLLEFETLMVATLPPLLEVERLMVGRLPDCDLVIDDPSVSKRHASLRWDSLRRLAAMRDLGSTNGTLLNGGPLKSPEVYLKDWDVVTFGEVSFCYVLTDSLFTRLSRSRSPLK